LTTVVRAHAAPFCTYVSAHTTTCSINVQETIEAVTCLLAYGFDTAQHVVACSAAGAIAKLAASCTQPGLFTRRSAAFAVQQSAMWLKEKAKKQVAADITALYIAMAAIVGPNIVLNSLCSFAASNAKLPVVVEKVNELIGVMFSRFGINRVAVAPMLSHLLSAQGVLSTAVPLKAAAKSSLAIIYKQMGPLLEAALGKKAYALDEKTLEALRKELQAVGFSLSSSLDDLIEKTDLMAALPKTILADLDTPNETGSAKASSVPGAGGGATGEPLKPWQVRLDALDSVSAALDKAIRSGGVEVNEGISMLLKAVARRLADSQTNLRPRAITVIGSIAKACRAPAASAYMRFTGKA
jgi:hypothetical protein